MRTTFCRTIRINAHNRTNDGQPNTHSGHGWRYSTQGRGHPNAITGDPYDHNQPGHSNPIPTMGTNHDHRGSLNTFAEPLPEVRGTPGNSYGTTRTTSRTGHRDHRYSWITSKVIGTPKTRHHTKGPRSHPDGRYENEKGQHRNTLGPHQ